MFRVLSSNHRLIRYEQAIKAKRRVAIKKANKLMSLDPSILRIIVIKNKKMKK